VEADRLLKGSQIERLSRTGKAKIKTAIAKAKKLLPS
jgi:hypothetical protein